MTDTEIAFASATKLLAMMDAGELSSAELTAFFLERVARFNPALMGRLR